MKRHDLVINGIDYNLELDRLSLKLQFRIGLSVLTSGAFKIGGTSARIKPLNCQLSPSIEKIIEINERFRRFGVLSQGIQIPNKYIPIIHTST